MIKKMNAKIAGLLFLSILSIAGCAGSPMAISMMSPDELRNQDTISLCKAYGFNGSIDVKNELIRRDSVPKWEWELIDQKKIKIGMSEYGLICSWGHPGLYGAVNTSVNRYGIRKQWVYRACTMCKSNYIYTENGKVVSWQD